jgi:hypothetical protein
MDQQHLSVIQIGDNIFGATGKLVDSASGQTPNEIVGKRRSQIGSALNNRCQHMPFHNRGQAPANCFHFWQFGHFDLVTGYVIRQGNI